MYAFSPCLAPPPYPSPHHLPLRMTAVVSSGQHCPMQPIPHTAARVMCFQQISVGWSKLLHSQLTILLLISPRKWQIKQKFHRVLPPCLAINLCTHSTILPSFPLLQMNCFCCYLKTTLPLVFQIPFLLTYLMTLHQLFSPLQYHQFFLLFWIISINKQTV